MIDFITLVKSDLSDVEINSIVEANDLQTNSKDGVVFYDNSSTKNFIQQKGVFIRIETNQRLKLECSLHKYFNEISGRERNNFNMFSMAEARRSIDQLLYEKNVSPNNVRIYNYEIGLNLNLSKDCRSFLDKMKSIGSIGNEKQLYVNARYKDERVKTTVFHQHTRKFFKVYDKVFECKDRKRSYIPDDNILRIETVNRRLDNCLVSDFFSTDNLKKMVESFFRDWRTIQFEQDIITPKGTGRARQQLCLEIMDKGKEAVLERAKQRHNNGSLKDWEYRNIREFITKEWDIIKKDITFIQSDEEKEFRHLMKVNYNLLKSDEYIN
ncbi:MAG: hypothetical protein QM653_05300 [Dysgonomonas sp.]|uniref:hypothetical protein n=1 Tax=Dysgonomonas sp. TaxID=1891233 RepID=UPI0039E4DA66